AMPKTPKTRKEINLKYRQKKKAEYETLENQIQLLKNEKLRYEEENKQRTYDLQSSIDRLQGKVELLQEQNKEQKAEFEMQIRNICEKHATEIKNLKQKHLTDIKDLREQYEVELIYEENQIYLGNFGQANPTQLLSFNEGYLQTFTNYHNTDVTRLNLGLKFLDLDFNKGLVV
ncbi:35242_t:CDS:2, partial [Racocetra persica]